MHISTQRALWWTDKAPLLLCESSHICEERSQLLPLTCLVLCIYSTGHYFINRDRTAITNVNWSLFLCIVWDPAAGCNSNKHKGNRAFDIRSTSAPGRGEGAPDPHVSPQKRKNYITDVQQEYSAFPTSHCTSTPPPSLSLCARVAQQVAEIRLLSKDRFHCESTSTTLWCLLRQHNKRFHGSVIFKNEGLCLEIKYEHGMNVHNQPANMER